MQPRRQARDECTCTVGKWFCSGPQIVFMCFVCCPEKTPGIAANDIKKKLVFIMDTDCVFCAIRNLFLYMNNLV